MSSTSRDIYVEVLGMQVAMEDPVHDLPASENPTAEVIDLQRPETE